MFISGASASCRRKSFSPGMSRDPGRIRAAGQDVEAVHAQAERRVVGPPHDLPGPPYVLTKPAPGKSLVRAPAGRARRGAIGQLAQLLGDLVVVVDRVRGHRRADQDRSVPRRCMTSNLRSALRRLARRTPGARSRSPGTAGRGRSSGRDRRSVRAPPRRPGAATKSGSKISTPSNPAPAAAASLSSRVPEMQTVASAVRTRARVAAADGSTGDVGWIDTDILGTLDLPRRSGTRAWKAGAAQRRPRRTGSVGIAPDPARAREYGRAPVPASGRQPALGLGRHRDGRGPEPPRTPQELAERAAAVRRPEQTSSRTSTPRGSASPSPRPCVDDDQPDACRRRRTMHLAADLAQIPFVATSCWMGGGVTSPITADRGTGGSRTPPGSRIPSTTRSGWRTGRVALTRDVVGSAETRGGRRTEGVPGPRPAARLRSPPMTSW